MGLTRQHHAELNRINSTPARFAELRREYAGDATALQQIDVYDPASPYQPKIRALTKAIKSDDKTRAAELLAWFKEFYPNV
jgi:hypothetical protein